MTVVYTAPYFPLGYLNFFHSSTLDLHACDLCWYTISDQFSLEHLKVSSLRFLYHAAKIYSLILKDVFGQQTNL